MALFWRRHPVRDEDLSALLDGELEAARRERVESHLETCAACRAAIDELRAVRAALAALPRAQTPRSFALRQADIEAGMVLAAPSALGRAPALLGGLAMVAFVAFFVLLGVDLSDGSSEPSAGPAVRPLSGAVEQYDAADGDAAAPQSEEGGDGEVRDDNAGELSPPPDVAPGEESAELPEPAVPDSENLEPSAEQPLARGAGTDDDSGLRAAEAAAAAIGLVAIGSLALMWWRRRVAN